MDNYELLLINVVYNCIIVYGTHACIVMCACIYGAYELF